MVKCNRLCGSNMRIRYRCLPRPKSNGFSLIELLVVISIIAFLIALMLPSLDKVRFETRVVTCMSNQRQFMLGVTSYYADWGNPRHALPSSSRYPIGGCKPTPTLRPSSNSITAIPRTTKPRVRAFSCEANTSARDGPCTARTTTARG